MSGLTQSAEQQNPHILVVDDEPGIRQMLPLCLKKFNYRISCAGDASEASKLLVLEQFDAIICDVMMPGEDGISFLGRVHTSWPEIPVVLMTGHAQMQMAIQAIKNGAFDFVCKPFDFDYMCRTVERAVNYSKLQRMEKNYRAELEETVARRTAELKESMVELDFARTALLQGAVDKNTFMLTASLEMLAPMNSVIDALALLSEENLTGAASEYLAVARRSADSMLELVNRLQLFNTLNVQGGEARHCDLVDVKFLLHTIIVNQQPLFNRKGVALSLLIADDLPLLIWTDREKLSRLFEILLGNALKFTEYGAVSLSAFHTFSEEEGDVLLCTVTDSGIGIPDGMLERIFEPFVQADRSSSRQHDGVGLGLAIARQNALLLNGHLWAEHVPAGGSRFCVAFKISTP